MPNHTTVQPKWNVMRTAETDLADHDIRLVAEGAGRSAFSIHVHAPMVSVLGSGFAVPDGIVTAKHVLSPVIVPDTGDTIPGAIIRVRELASGTYRNTQIRYVARDYDVAVLDAPPGVSPLTWGDSEHLAVGDNVVVLAAPNTLGETFVAYAAAGRVLALSTVVPDLFRYAIPVQPGSSGGPVLILNAEGKIVGINLLQERQGNAVMGVGLKSNRIRAVLGGTVLPHPQPVLLPEGLTGTDLLILGGAVGVTLYALRAIFRL